MSFSKAPVLARFYSNGEPIPITLKTKGCDDILKKHFLFRVHGSEGQRTAEDANEFIKGYFDLWNQRVKMTCEPSPLPYENDLPAPWDVFIETAVKARADIAHAAGWSYLTGRGVRKLTNGANKSTMGGGETK